MDELHAHHEVLIEKGGWVVPVGANSTHARRQVNDNVGASVAEQPRYILTSDQIIFFGTRRKNLLGAPSLQRLDHKTPQETGTSGHQDPLARPLHPDTFPFSAHVRVARSEFAFG